MAPKNSLSFSNPVLLKVLCLKESDDDFCGTRRITYLCNILVANKETVENLMGIYVTWGSLVTQYNCLEFKSFGRILLLSHFQFQQDWKFYIWKNLTMISWNFNLLNLLASLIMALLVPVHFIFIQEKFVEGFVSKK